MNFKRSFLALALLSLISFAFIKKGADPVEKIVTALQRWSDNNPQEKVYLHTDKPYYVVGDTIWFKAYVTIGSKHQLSAMSGALYVDLIKESDSLVTALKLPVTAGRAKGNFILADSSFKEGNYRIRAYTQWMRNAGSSYFYDKVFSVGNSVTNPVFAKIDYEYSKEGAKTAITAVLTYTNDKGEPLANKTVNYDLLEDYDVITTQKKTTDANGILRIVLQPGKSGKIIGTRIQSRINTVDKEFISKDFLVKALSTSSDLQFFPEGGPLVNGVRSRVAFKATGTNGLGVAVKGVVTDSENNPVGEFQAQNFGMGFFRLMPEAGKTYQAKVTYPDGSESVVKLPAALTSGYVLSVFNNPETDTILVRINASADLVKTPGQAVSIVVQTGGNVHMATTIPITKAAISIPIPAKELPSGIAQFTLFSSTGDALNERIAFVQNNDMMNLKLSSAKQSYTSKEKIEVTLEALDEKNAPSSGNFSVSVINEAAVPLDESKETTILSHILLSSDIKGYIERPNYYFAAPSVETKNNLDLLMMTQGYRRFVWKDIIAEAPFNLPYKAEKLTSEITGKLMTLNNKPVANGKVMLMSNKLAGLPPETTTDANGVYIFKDLIITSEIQFSVQGKTDKGSDKVEIKVDRTRDELMSPNPNVPDLDTDLRKTLQASFDNAKKQEEDLQKRGMLGRTQQLKEVQITSGKKKRAFGMDMIMEGHADQTVRYAATDIAYMNILEWMKFKIPNITFRQDNSDQCGPVEVAVSRGEVMNIFVDGRKITQCESQDFFLMDPADIARLDVVRTNAALINMMGGAGLSFTTKRGMGSVRKVFNPNMTNINPRGYNVVREFYSPVYKGDGNDSRIADLRTTVYWNPSLMTDDKGKATFSFFNGDGKGTHRVLVEGINADGTLGRKIYKYEVK
ncbi:MAG: TonB-dependent receptor [Bacteroidota bacterium]